MGLELNIGKTKLLTTEDGHYREGRSAVRHWAGCWFHLLGPHEWHKYLGGKLCLGPKARANTEIKNRIAAAWTQFTKHRRTLTNRSLSLRGRLRLFDACVTPCVMYGIGACTCTAQHRAVLDRTQRRMLRLVVGWVRVPDEAWRDTMVRMNSRVAHGRRL